MTPQAMYILPAVSCAVFGRSNIYVCNGARSQKPEEKSVAAERITMAGPSARNTIHRKKPILHNAAATYMMTWWP